MSGMRNRGLVKKAQVRSDTLVISRTRAALVADDETILAGA
jgi:hypothetical protein